MKEKIKSVKSQLRNYIFALIMIISATLIFIQGRVYFAKGQWALLYLLLIVFIAIRSGVQPAILSAIIAFFSWNFFFLPPYHTFHVYDPKDWLSLFAFLIVGIIMGMQTGRLRERESLARMREQETTLLNTFSAHLVSDLSIDEMADILASDVAGNVKADCAILFTAADSGSINMVRPSGDSCAADEFITQLAGWSFNQSKAIGLHKLSKHELVSPDGWPVSATYAEAGISQPKNAITIPLQTATRKLGVLYIGEKKDGSAYSDIETKLLVSVANQAAAFLERKHLQTIAVQANALREADRMKSTFMSSISHELKTPLASITATLSNLLEGDLIWDENNVHEEITAVLDDLERLNDSISSLVDLSRLESSAWNPNRDWYEIGEILGTVLSRIPQKKRERIVFSLPDRLPSINIDFAQWVRVLNNLIENALDYTNESTNVYIGASSANSKDTRIWVEDCGQGIPSDEREKIFEKFYRGSTSSKVSSGTGLGLAIAKEIVRSHGGKIWVENVEPHGARFVISLPHELKEGKEL